MTEHVKWQWQEPGTAWKGVGVYHVTLTVPSREPLFGTLVIPENSPSNARIERWRSAGLVFDSLEQKSYNCGGLLRGFFVFDAF